MSAVRKRTSVEVCAGAGGQALGLEQAGYRHLVCVELDPHALATLRHNRPRWNPVQADLNTWTWDGPSPDLLAGGVPCPPFSIAGKQLGEDDDRDLFPAMLRLTGEMGPRAVMIENVRGLLASKFEGYRAGILDELDQLGYIGEWRLLNAADYGVPQARLRTVLVAMRPSDWDHFKWPKPLGAPPTVGETLLPAMASDGWEGADSWADQADGIAPALVGGSKKHGGADLGPTRARAAWRLLGVDGLGVADQPPREGHVGLPRLTVPMAALVQGFPPDWQIQGRKTAAYRQVGNAFPPPVAKAVGRAIRSAMDRTDKHPAG